MFKLNKFCTCSPQFLYQTHVPCICQMWWGPTSSALGSLDHIALSLLSMTSPNPPWIPQFNLFIFVVSDYMIFLSLYGLTSAFRLYFRLTSMLLFFKVSIIWLFFFCSSIVFNNPAWNLHIRTLFQCTFLKIYICIYLFIWLLWVFIVACGI